MRRHQTLLATVLVLGLLLPLLAKPLRGEVPSESFRISGAPRDEDGRFTNPVGNLTHGSFGVRFSFMWRRMAGAFRGVRGAPARVINKGVYLRENARHSAPTITWVGHSTLLVQMDHLTFLTDPIWSDRPSPVPFVGPRRFVAPGIEIADLPPIDFVVVSHNHYDHLDLPSLRALAERDPDTRFFVPLGNGALLRKKGIDRVEELDWGQATQHEGVMIHCLPAQHWSKRSLTDDRKALWSSWAVIGSDRRFYFAGDTGYFDGFEQIGQVLGPFDLVAMPIGAYAPSAMMRESHMDPEEAILASLDLRAERVVAMHFGTFDLSDEPLDEPPLRFKAAAKSTSIGQDGAWVLSIGETRGF